MKEELSKVSPSAAKAAASFLALSTMALVVAYLFTMQLSINKIHTGRGNHIYPRDSSVGIETQIDHVDAVRITAFACSPSEL